MKPTVIRIVDDDSDVCDSLSCLLSLEGWEIRIYTDPKEFLAGDLLTDPGCLILDFRFPTTNGLEVQKVLIERQIRMPIIFLTAHGDIPLAVKAMQRGAVDFLTKPVDTDHLIAAIERALRVDTLHRHGFNAQADLDWTLNDLRDREKMFCGCSSWKTAPISKLPKDSSFLKEPLRIIEPISTGV